MTETRPVTRSAASLGGLVDALDVLIADGAAVAGDLVIAIDDVDLIRLDVRLLLTGIADAPEPEDQP